MAGRVVGTSPLIPKMPWVMSPAMDITVQKAATMRSVSRVPCAVLAPIDEKKRESDEGGEDERDHASERDASVPEGGGQRHVADRADEAEHGDDRADERAPDHLDGVWGAGEEQAVEEPVTKLGHEPGQEK